MSLNFDANLIKSFSPINSLSSENKQDLVSKVTATSVKTGHYVFKKGDTEKCHVYVLEGEIELVLGKKVIKLIKAGTPGGLQPIAHSFPRVVSARAKSPKFSHL